ncbi:hypothetical protein HNR19_002015 [Nocardioides thalensis]|uniref:Uncharacterized protein n=1 Tax=Nocardioides thalensis TaxID=1914755 RepID=A0A853C2C3_9ACTN|nr:hypothetical protein [Nocardioides thalensis]NYJ01317.1 hypothetical protein [Nocardioides thalensis]
MTTSASLLPVSGRLAWWATAWLRGLVGPDDLLDAVLAGDVTHVVAGAEGPTGLVPALAAARAGGADAVGAAFPVSGDPVALRGPREFTGAAIDAGEAVVLLGAGAGWVPRAVGRAVEWDTYTVDRRPPPDLGEADRGLRAAVLATANDLARLDVARWRPEVADALHDLRAGEPVSAPPGVPTRCLDLAGRALHLGWVVDLALDDEGAAVSASEMSARRDALLPLERAVRHALTAACSPDGWPPA